MLRRRIGSRGPEVSQLTFGTMRLDKRVDNISAADFLCHLHDECVDTHHSSFEYDSHATYLDALTTARKTGRTFQHIVKLSSPGFDSVTFDPEVLTKEIDRELRELNTEQLACVQWLVRTPDPSNHAAHAKIMSEQKHAIETVFRKLIDSGKVASFVHFPYSVASATAATSLAGVSGLCIYLNLIETDFVPFLENTSALAIRPLAAGKLVHDPVEARLATGIVHKPDVFETSLQFPLRHPNVTTIITSMRTINQADSSIRVVRETTPDLAEFNRICTAATAVVEE